MTRWIVVVVTGFLIAGCSSKKEAPRPLASGVERTRPARSVTPLPGTEAAHRLLAGVGHGAATADGTAVALGGVFGKGGVLGGGPSLGLGLAGKPDGPHPIGPLDRRSIDDEPASAPTPVADDPPVANAPPIDVDVPPPLAAGGDCGAVATRIGDLAAAMMEAEMRGISDDAREITAPMVRDALAEVGRTIETTCRSQAWPQPLMDCLLTGTDFSVLQACERLAPPQMRADAQAAAGAGAAPPRPSTKPPVWTRANRDCAAVAQHATDVIEWEMTAVPPDIAAQMSDLLPQVAQGVAAACATWPPAITECALNAGSLAALDACAATGP